MTLVLVLLLAALIPERAADLDAQGRAAFRAGQFRQAVGYFERSLALTPKGSGAEAMVRSNAGQAYLALGNRSRAEGAFRSALGITPTSAKLWHLLGQVLLLEKRYSEGEAALQTALSIWGTSRPTEAAAALSDLSIVYQAQQRWRQALETLEKAAALVPAGQARARVMGNIGTLSWKLGKKKQAAIWMSQALAEMEKDVGADHPDVARILDDYAVVLRGTGHGGEAKTCERRVREIRSAFAAQSGHATVDWRDLK